MDLYKELIPGTDKERWYFITPDGKRFGLMVDPRQEQASKDLSLKVLQRKWDQYYQKKKLAKQKGE